MKTHIRTLTWIAGILLTALVLGEAMAAPPDKTSVTGANPNSALQGESLDVVISGSGFGQGATVRFLVSGTRDDSQIAVNNVTYNEGDGTLTASIQVQGTAVVSDYDIEVQPLSGRKGKGTTLFSVFSSNGGGNSAPITMSCDDLFGLTPGTCTAEGSSDPCLFAQDSNTDRAWYMTQNCDTRAMLVVRPDYPFLLGKGFRLNLVQPWSGDYAGITNARGATRIADVHVAVADPAVAGGCGVAGTVQAAVFFDPDLQPRSSSPRGYVTGIVVETGGGARFCNGIEYVGSDPHVGEPYKEAAVTSSHILADSYERFGIWMANINLSDLNDQVKNEFARVQDNIVEASDTPCATAVVVGPNVERPQVDGNLVYAASGCAQRTVGIAVLDSGRDKASPLGPDYDFLTARSAGLSGNTVQTGGGGSIGILIDGASDAEMTRSQITAGEGNDYAVCVETGGNFAEIKKASDYIGFDAGNEIVHVNDCGAVVP